MGPRFTRFDTLAGRTVLLLSLVLLPLALYGSFQARQVGRALDANAHALLIAKTAEAVAPQGAIIQQALGTAEHLAFSTDQLEPIYCNILLSGVVTKSEAYEFAGRMKPDGTFPCASARVEDSGLSMTPQDRFQRQWAQAESIVSTGAFDGAKTGPMMLVGHPVFDGDTLKHSLVLGIPSDQFLGEQGGSPTSRSLLIVTAKGTIAAGFHTPAQIADGAPNAGLDSTKLTHAGMVFRGETQSGKPRAFAVVPIHDTDVYALASWPPELLNGAPKPSVLLPLAMWLLTIATAFLVTNVFVLRHLRDLRGRMHSFAIDRSVVKPRKLSWLGEPFEMFEMKADFAELSEALVADEIELKSAVKERGRLNREIHHRVNNNLQLVSSLMNLQVRHATPEAEHTIRNLQKRVINLAQVHKVVYGASSSTSVPVDTLIGEVFDTTLNGHINADAYQLDLQTFNMAPEKAIPFALLSAELAKQVVENLNGHDTATDPQLTVTLSQKDAMCQMIVAHETPAKPPAHSDEMIAQMINIFQRQLHATLDVTMANKQRALVLRFPIEPAEITAPDAGSSPGS